MKKTVYVGLLTEAIVKIIRNGILMWDVIITVLGSHLYSLKDPADQRPSYSIILAAETLYAVILKVSCVLFCPIGASVVVPAPCPHRQGDEGRDHSEAKRSQLWPGGEHQQLPQSLRAETHQRQVTPPKRNQN